MDTKNPIENRHLVPVVIKAIGFAWRTNKKLFLVLFALNLFQGAIVYLQFTSFASIVDGIIAIKQGSGTAADLVVSSILLGISFLLPAIASNAASYYRTAFRLAQNVHMDLFRIDKQSSLDIGTLESSTYQNLLRSAREWGTDSILSLQDFAFVSASSFAGILTSIIILWSLNPWLVLFAVLAAAPIYFVYKKYSVEVFRVRWFSVEDHRIIWNRISHFEDLHKTIDVILLKLKEWFKVQIKERMENYNGKVGKAERKKSISYSLLGVWYLIFLFSAIALMTHEALAGNIAVGALLLAFSTYTRFYQTVNAYIESISFTEEAARYASRWFDLFELKPKVTSHQNPDRISFDGPPLIEFNGVSFRYPHESSDSPMVLHNLSFSIKPGEKIAITGMNGSGKTTLIKLLCRIYDPTEGSILVNGIDLRKIDLEDWQASLGVLFQDFPTYNLTIRESIGIGRVSLPFDEARLSQAAGFSGADEFIESFPGRYDQLIWKEFKDGTDLSKGQHQRLAVARMFYRNAVLTILDEPTASIDAVTEEKIFTTLEQNMQGKTVILITHRFSTVKNADKILVLEHGSIIEQGTHKELMKVNGKYASLYSMQAKRYLESEMPEA